MGKKKKVKASKATSAFSGVNTYNINNNGFGSATSTKDGNTISTTSSLSPDLESIRQSTVSGLNNNSNYLNRSPEQQMQDLDAGNNNLYNYQNEINRRQSASDLADAQMRYSNTGLENSTARGAFDAQLSTDNLIKDLATRQMSLDYSQQNALQSGAFNAGLLDQLYGYVQDPTALSSQNLMQGFQNADQVAMFNAQQQQQAAALNAQLAAQRQQMWSSLAGNAISAGSLAAAPLTGGASLAGLAFKGLGSAAKGAQSFLGSRM